MSVRNAASHADVFGSMPYATFGGDRSFNTNYYVSQISHGISSQEPRRNRTGLLQYC